MNDETLNNLLTKANECNNNGNFDEAETLAGELLAELEKISESTDTITARQRDNTHCEALITLSVAKRSRGDYHEALTLARAALDLAKEKNLPDETYAKALGNIGNVYRYLSDYSQALTHYQKALAIYEEIASKNGIASNLTNIGIVYEYLSDNLQALTYYQKALAINEEIGSKNGIANNFCNIGNVYRKLSDYPQALTYYQKALASFEEIGSKEGIASNLGNIGNVYQNLSDNAQALTYYQKALTINEEIGRKNGIAINLGNIGIVYQNLSDYPQALTYYQKALAINEEIGSKYGIASNLANIGIVYQELSDSPQALTYYQKALAIHEEIGSKYGIANDLGNIGIVYQYLSDYPQALIYFQKALAINGEIGSKNGIARNLGTIGVLYANKEFDGYETDKAEEFLLRAIALLEDIGEKLNLYVIHESLADLYETQERWKEHSIQFKKYHTIYLEVQSEEATKQAQQMEYRRKIEESERDRQVKLARFQEQEKILHNILPSQIANRMIEGEKTIVDGYESVSVLFADIVGFTKLSQRVTPEQLVAGLDGIFNTFDLLADKYGCEKIKTIGDCYMVVAGLPERCDDHAERLGAMAIDMLKAIEELPAIVEDISITMRIGIHSGSVVAGIIGKNKYAYDLWGDAVNTASRMESHGEAGKIHCSEEFMQALAGKGKELSQEPESSLSSLLSLPSFQFEDRGEMHIKGKGMMKTYYLEKA